MPKQESILKVRGTIDELNFYKKNGEYLIRRKGGIDKERILKDPKFARTRENMEQFKAVALDLKLFRDSFPNLKKNIAGKIAFTSLSRLMYQVTKLDTISPRGKRKLSIGIREAGGIEGFKHLSLVHGALLNQLLLTPYAVNRTTGVVTTNPFIPENEINYPDSATHYNMQACVVAIDFNQMISEVFYTNTVQGPIDMTETTVTLTPTAFPTLPGDVALFVIMSFTFSQFSNGFYYPLKSNHGTAMEIIDAFNS